MSKVQSALQKIRASGGGPSSSVNDAAEVKTAIEARNKPDKSSKTSSYKTTIKVDLGVLADEGMALPDEYEKELRHELRQIKWPLLANAFGKQSKLIPRGNVVMVASATSGDGKTFTAVNLAMSIAAEKDIDVLLVDADILKPHTSSVLGLTEHAGVIDYLSGEVEEITDVIVGTDIPGLSLLPAGRADEHASELIASNRMSDLISDLSARLSNTIVLFDTSPILQTNESQALSRLVGQVLLVVAANKTPQQAVKDAISLLGPDLVTNVIFNNVSSLFGRKHGYGGYYGYQSRA